jgi:hypothetical protein
VSGRHRDAGGGQPLRTIQRAAHDALESWVTPLSAMLTARGVAGTEATTLARWAIAALEAALVLARAARDDAVVTSCRRSPPRPSTDGSLPDRDGRVCPRRRRVVEQARRARSPQSRSAPRWR